MNESLYGKCQRAILSSYEDLKYIEPFLPVRVFNDLTKLRNAENVLKTTSFTNVVINNVL